MFHHQDRSRSDWLISPQAMLLVFLLAGLAVFGVSSTPEPAFAASGPGSAPQAASTVYIPIILNTEPNLGAYILLGWNDLGMHCYNLHFQDLAVLPPYNTLWAQVIKRGDPPQIVTQGVRVQYSFPDNTTSVTKSDFWTYAPQLFGVSLPDNVGLKGKGLADVMDAKTGYFIAEGIPLTEYNDSDLLNRYPFQKALLVAKDIATGTVLATLTVVAPVSTEMHCDNCHATGKDPGGNQARTELNILAFHDSEEGTKPDEQPPGVVRSLPQLECPGRARGERRPQPVEGHAYPSRRGGPQHPGRLLQLPPGTFHPLPARHDVPQYLVEPRSDPQDELHRLPRDDEPGGPEPRPMVERAPL